MANLKDGVAPDFMHWYFLSFESARNAKPCIIKKTLGGAEFCALLFFLI